ncbi:uncharacterized protein LOC144121153 isoform X1 [Amblyomma americanum]
MEGKLTKRSKAHQARPKRGSEKHGKHEKRDHDKHGNQGKPTRPGESKDAPGADSKSPEDDKAADPFPLPDAPPRQLLVPQLGRLHRWCLQKKRLRGGERKGALLGEAASGEESRSAARLFIFLFATDLCTAPNPAPCGSQRLRIVLLNKHYSMPKSRKESGECIRTPHLAQHRAQCQLMASAARHRRACP